MANRRWLNDRKTVGFESSKKSVNIRVHDAFFLLFFYFFYQASASPPLAPVRPPLILHAHTPRAFQESRFPVRRVSRCWTRRNHQNSVRMLQNVHFVAFIIALLGRFHASSTPATPTKPPTNPVKSTIDTLHAHELTNTENP